MSTPVPAGAAEVPPAVLAVTGGGDSSSIGPGLAGFLAIFAITLASWVLFRSMSKHLRRVRHSPDPSAAPPVHPGGARPGNDGDGGGDGDDGGGAGAGEPGPPFREEPPGGPRR